ncbi:MAG: PQQ-binding-like beta-propeller repeat protein, partial [Porticoccaceae bacterium]
MKKLALLCCALMLSGCSWMKFWESDEDKALAPAPLVKFDEEVRVRKLWSRSAGSGQDPLYASLVPVLDGGVLYAADGKGRVYALDAETGKVKWQQKLDKSLSGGVGAGGGLVLVADLRGTLFALDAATGDVRWRVKIHSEML